MEQHRVKRAIDSIDPEKLRRIMTEGPTPEEIQEADAYLSKLANLTPEQKKRLTRIAHEQNDFDVLPDGTIQGRR